MVRSVRWKRKRKREEKVRKSKKKMILNGKKWTRNLNAKVQNVMLDGVVLVKMVKTKMMMDLFRARGNHRGRKKTSAEGKVWSSND